MNTNSLPDVLSPLIALPHWIIWRWETSASGKPTKVPYQAAHPNLKASSTDARTWTDFPTALAASEQADGIGFCLFNTEIAAFDADDCRNAESGALEAWAQELVDRSNSYTEITPSGTGLRIIGFGKGPKVHRKQTVTNGTTLETFPRAERYITVTGNVLTGTPMLLSNLDALIDTVVAKLDHRNANEAESTTENPDLKIDWNKVQQHAGWLKNENDLPSDFSAKGIMIVAHSGSFKDLNDELMEAGLIEKPYDSNWSSVSFALATIFKADGRFTTEQIAAALICDLPCNQHITKLKSVYQKRRAVERLLSRSYDPPLTREDNKSVVTICAADVVMRSKQWVWPNHLLCGALELLTGIPGLGKSQVQANYVACVTTGKAWPDGSIIKAVGNVLMITAEDTLDQEVVPRLKAAGADLSRVFFLDYIKTDKKHRQFLLAEDLEAIERKMQEIGDLALITVDPITAYMGGKLDSHKATEVRSQLGPLKDFSERTEIALSAITHPAKNASHRAIDQFIGSQAFIAAARLGHVCIPEFKFEDVDGMKIKVPTGRVLFTHAKHNPCARQPTWAYRIEVANVGNDLSTNDIIDGPYVIWDQEPVDITADDAVAAATGTQRDDERGKQKQLQDFLCERLKYGPVPAVKIEAEAASLKFTKSQIETAKKQLGIVSGKTGFDGGWEWKSIL
jgi:hypothetical protein